MEEKERYVYYSRKIPLKNIVVDPEMYQDAIFRTNEVVRQTYQFLRMYVLYLFENNLEIPKINRSFIKVIFSLVSMRRANSNVTKELLDFYNQHYLPLQPEKVNGKKLKDVLNGEKTNIVTAIENHIKNHFYDHVRRLASCYSEDSTIRRKIVNMFWRKQMIADFLDNEEVMEYTSDIFSAKQVVYSKPQSVIPLLLRINRTLQEHEKKTFSVIPLRRTFIPKYITINKTNLKSTFDNEKGEQEWADITSTVSEVLKIKKGYHLYTLKTDGIGCSVCFESDEKHVITESSEKYLEDISTYSELLDKKVVAIDPNKGNLMYCYDGEKVLRYTQAQRRHETKKNKYNQIRKGEEDNYIVRLECEDDFISVKENEKILSQCNSRTTYFEEFKDYVKEKNLAFLRFGELYKEHIFRKLNFNAKINSDRNEDRFLNRFQKTFGDPRDVVVIFGDWNQRPGMSYGKEPTKGKGCRKMLRKAGYDVILKDEFRTSKLCSECHSENEEKFITRKNPRWWVQNEVEKVWGLLRCTNVNCRKVHNRDFNSVRNIHFLSTCIISGVEIPDVFRRGNNHACATPNSRVDLAS